jgi:hypothetical protein
MSFLLTLVALIGLSIALTQDEKEGICAILEATKTVTFPTIRGDCAAVDQCCSWDGIQCVSGHVTGLILAVQSKPSSIPSELGLLSYLVSLTVNDVNPSAHSGNGTIDGVPEIARLKLLTNLSIRLYTQLNFPELGAMVSLRKLDVTVSTALHAKASLFPNVSSLV